MKKIKNPLDKEGYPTEELLEFIKNYIPDSELDIKTFIEEVIIPNWYYEEGIKYKPKKKKLELHTYGWSGNEDIIEAMLQNIFLSVFPLEYTKWITGGHHYFKIKKYDVIDFDNIKKMKELKTEKALQNLTDQAQEMGEY